MVALTSGEDRLAEEYILSGKTKNSVTEVTEFSFKWWPWQDSNLRPFDS